LLRYAVLLRTGLERVDAEEIKSPVFYRNKKKICIKYDNNVFDQSSISENVRKHIQNGHLYKK